MNQIALAAFLESVEVTDAGIAQELATLAATLPEPRAEQLRDFADRLQIESERRVAWLQQRMGEAL